MLLLLQWLNEIASKDTSKKYEMATTWLLTAKISSPLHVAI
jgi:hypothetical protein